MKTFLTTAGRRLAVLALFAIGLGAVGVQQSVAAPGTFAFTGTMGTARRGHTATLLQNGKVLVAGGDAGNGELKSAELYCKL
jgi:large repetitive protein